MIKRKFLLAQLLGLVLTGISSHAFPQNNISVAGGTDTAVESYIERIAYRKKLDREFTFSSRRTFLTYVEGSLGAWQGESTRDNGFVSIGLRYILATPIYALENTWFEVGTGPLAISDLRLNDDESWGYKLQFDSHLGFVFRFKDSDFSIGYGFHHISNAGLGDENHGLNLHMLSLRRHL